MQTLKHKKTFFLFFYFLFFIFPQLIFAASLSCSGLDAETKKICENIKSTDCDTLDGDAKDKCESADERGVATVNMLKLNNKTQGALANQIDNINSEQTKTLTQLQETQKKVQTLGQQIESLAESIKDEEIALNYQKKILAGLMQSYFEYDQQGILPIILANKNFSDILNQSDYIEQSGVKVSSILAEVVKTRQKLIDDQNILKQKKEESDKAKEDLLDKKYDLQATENQKTNLLVQTQGEEEKYKQLLARVEAQKEELFDFSAASDLDEVNSSVSSYPKPSSNLASTSWYFSQKDSRWGNKKIGNSKTLMKDYGCAVTAVSMVFREKGASIDPGKMASQKIYYYDLIKWPTSWSLGIKLVSSTYHGNVSWSKVDSEIKKDNPVIVYIKRSRGGGHYVVITGKDSKDYIVHDPYFGANLYLSTSKSLVGKIGVDSKVSIDQMIVYN